MKKFFVYILLTCYFAFTSGVVISQHFCMNTLASSGIFAEKEDTCGRCGMHIDDTNGCCKDEVKLVKLDDEQKTSTAYYSISPSVNELFTDLSAYLYAGLINEGRQHQRSHNDYPPPLLKGQDTYLINGVFRI